MHAQITLGQQLHRYRGASASGRKFCELKVPTARQGYARQSPTASYPQYGSQGGFGGFGQARTHVAHNSTCSKQGQQSTDKKFRHVPCNDMTGRAHRLHTYGVSSRPGASLSGAEQRKTLVRDFLGATQCAACNPWPMTSAASRLPGRTERAAATLPPAEGRQPACT